MTEPVQSTTYTPPAYTPPPSPAVTQTVDLSNMTITQMKAILNDRDYYHVGQNPFRSTAELAIEAKNLGISAEDWNKFADATQPAGNQGSALKSMINSAREAKIPGTPQPDLPEQDKSRIPEDSRAVESNEDKKQNTIIQDKTTGSYVVRRGDTLSKIAKEHGVTVEDIAALNPQITNPNIISVGAVLEISGEQHREQGAATQKAAPTPAETATTPGIALNKDLDFKPPETLPTYLMSQNEDAPIQENASPKDAAVEKEAPLQELTWIPDKTTAPTDNTRVTRGYTVPAQSPAQNKPVDPTTTQVEVVPYIEGPRPNYYLGDKPPVSDIKLTSTQEKLSISPDQSVETTQVEVNSPQSLKEEHAEKISENEYLYDVQPGDNMSKIADIYGTSVQRILWDNKSNTAENTIYGTGNLIKEGQKLTIKTSELMGEEKSQAQTHYNSAAELEKVNNFVKNDISTHGEFKRNILDYLNQKEDRTRVEERELNQYLSKALTKVFEGSKSIDVPGNMQSSQYPKSIYDYARKQNPESSLVEIHHDSDGSATYNANELRIFYKDADGNKKVWTKEGGVQDKDWGYWFPKFDGAYLVEFDETRTGADGVLAKNMQETTEYKNHLENQVSELKEGFEALGIKNPVFIPGHGGTTENSHYVYKGGHRTGAESPIANMAWYRSLQKIRIASAGS